MDHSYFEALAGTGMAGGGPEVWIDHNSILPAIEEMVSGYECRAVFVIADYGMGASSLLARLEERAKARTTVLAIGATPALAMVPYGALAPFLADVRGLDVSRVLVLRAIWERLQPAPGQEGPSLVVVDDAHVLDDASAGIITELVRTGWAHVVASSKPRPGVPEPMVQLWEGGWAERFDLQPLGPGEVLELCTLLLGGTVMESTGRSLWAGTGGNPLMVKTLVREFALNGALVQRNGVWQLSPAGMGSEPLETAEVVSMQLRRLSVQAREALNLIALAEPVQQEQVAALLGPEPVRELREERLVALDGPSGTTLSLLNPLYGEAVRHMVPAAASLELHRRFMASMEAPVDDPASLLRFVLWSLDCGAVVEDPLLVRAAEVACTVFLNDAALRIASAVHDALFRPRVVDIMARAHFNMGHYAQAGALLDEVDAGGTDLESMMLHSLLRAAVRTALGHPVSEISADAAALLAWGHREAERLRKDGDGGAADNVLAAASDRSAILELMAASRTGDYAAMERIADTLLGSGPAQSGPAGLLTRALALALDADRLCALGRPVSGLARAEEAFAIVQPEGQSVFFVPEFILVRLLACCLAAGEWEKTRDLLDKYFLTAGPAMVAFSGSIHTGIGYAAVRQGNMAQALPVLMSGMEALRESDPEQLMPLCAALAFYAAASLGQREVAESLMDEYPAWTSAGIYVVIANARDFYQAGVELLRRDGTGLAALLAAAESEAERHAGFLELHALELAIGLGSRTRLGRFTELAGRSEGSWAAALAKYGWALQTPDVAHFLRAGDALRDAGVFGTAASCYEGALSQMGRNHDRELVPRVRELLAQCKAATGTASASSAEAVQGSPAHTGGDLLTRREREVVALVLAGLTDREIADALHLSVRTVEGHLYRCYTKLGVTSRSQLAAVVGAEGSIA